MKRLSVSQSLLGLSFCLFVTIGNVNAVEKATEHPVKANIQADSGAKKGAMSLQVTPNGSEEPLYAGTSTWFLLSIALLGSIAVQRRRDVPE